MSVSKIYCSSPLFDEIYQKIKVSYPNCCLLYVEHIHNKKLEEGYEKQKENIQNKRGFVNEVEMFHGTTEFAKNSIIQDGFDPALNKKSAYGKGTYFHKQANYSKDYSEPDINELSYIFICNVLCGIKQAGKSKQVLDTELYDNFTNSDESIIVTPYRYGAIPKYCAVFYKNAS